MNLDIGDTRLIISMGETHGVLRNQLAYLLATSWHETGFTMKPVKEAYWLSESWRRDNLRYYPWYGRGYVQLTWEENYQRAQNKLGYPFHDNPDTALEPEPAAAVLIRGCMAGWFTGRKIPDYITLQRSDFVGARRVVNGTDRQHEIAAYAKEYDRDLLAEGYGVEDGEQPDPGEIDLDDVVARMKKAQAMRAEAMPMLEEADSIDALILEDLERMKGE